MNYSIQPAARLAAADSHSDRLRPDLVRRANAARDAGLRVIAETYGANGRFLLRYTHAPYNILAWPGPTLANVAESWLRHEAGAAGVVVTNLDELAGLVAQAEARICAWLERAA
jgi:hypothetical protein